MDKGRANMDIQGAFFSPYREDAEGYGGKVGAYYLSISNPASESVAYGALNKFKGQNYAGKKATQYLIKLGYDGVYNSYDEYIAFYPEQVKSATDNVGTFSRDNPDYTFSLRETTTEDLTCEYLESMQPTDRMTDSEKWLLGKYQSTLAEMRGKQAEAEKQEKLARTATSNDDRIKAENRAKVFRTQAGRLQSSLRSSEKE